VRNPAVALYAFCRLADDAVDGGGDRARAVADLKDRLDRAYAGRPDPNPADRAFAAVAARFAIPRALPDALIEGFAWDAEGRRYETLDDLIAYAVRVAGTVGAMMAVVMGERGARGVARACDLGVAMQLTNIARDVGEDARLGRIYLPLQDLRRAGIDPDAFLADPEPGPALAGVVARLLAAADELYARSEAGVATLPADCRPAIQAARRLYEGIGGRWSAAVGTRSRPAPWCRGAPRRASSPGRSSTPPG
jgi:phytoene synthase